MPTTPWTRKVAPSSLPSDRLRSKSATNANPKNSSTHQQPQLPQSKALRILNALLTSLQDPSTSSVPDPTGGCFCQARTHPLSPYVPICTSCALPLCNLAAPAHPCPSCNTPLITEVKRTALITRIEAEIIDTTLNEQIARERAEEERRAAAGAFPSLQQTSNLLGSSQPSSHYPSPSPSPSPVPQTHKVLSLNSKTKKTTLTTTTIKPKASSATPSPYGSRPASPQPTREPRPDANLGNDKGKGKGKTRVDPSRPWANFSGEGATYIPPGRLIDGTHAEGAAETGRRRRGKGKDKGKGKEVEVEVEVEVDDDGLGVSSRMDRVMQEVLKEPYLEAYLPS